MIYLLLAIVAALIAVLMLRLRIRVRLDSNHRLLFVGLGRSGPELDFAREQGVIRLFGIRIISFSLKKHGEARIAANVGSRVRQVRERALTGARTLKEGKGLFGDITKATWQYFKDLFRASIVEQFDGRIEAGFDSPDITGRTYGYYQALVGAVPAIGGRFTYVPVWTGSSFAGAFRFSIALPVYRLAYHTVRYWFRLPIRKMMRLTIGKKKGKQDVE